jgi:drug/metabolite transporter (DMT)-like permease
VLVSQAAGFVLVAAFIAIRGEGPPGGDFVVWAALSGAAGAAGLGAFYRGLSTGAMGVVAPISATAAIVPVVVGVATGDRPSAIQYAGIALAVAGGVLAAREPPEPGKPVRIATGVPLALAAALGFGLFFVGMDRASDADVGWAIFANRTTSVLLLAAAALALRPSVRIGRADLGALVAVGVLDISANGLFAVASTKGLVSLVAVIGSLYPLVVVALAFAVLKERLRPSQLAGAALALVGVVAISAG